jgi:multiple sugar transport system permease protein
MAATARRGPLLSRAVRRDLEGYLFAAPWILGFLFFAGGPMIASFALSFTDYNVFRDSAFVGLANYRMMFFEDTRFPLVVYNTLYFSGLSVAVSLATALAIALMLNRPYPGVRLLRTAYYVPSVAAGVAVTLVWVWLLDPHIGMVNQGLRLIGIEGPAWLASPEWAKIGLVMVSLWGLGNTMVIYLAALQGVPSELVEAASIDGAGTLRRFWHIVLPMISPTLLFTFVMAIIGSFQVFTLAFVMTEGGPANATLMYVLYLYRSGFQEFRMGYASALAWVLFLVIVLMTALVFRSSPYWVYYEAGGRDAEESQ